VFAVSINDCSLLVLVPSISVAVTLAMADLLTAMIAPAPALQTVMSQAAAFASGVLAVVRDLMDVDLLPPRAWKMRTRSRCRARANQSIGLCSAHRTLPMEAEKDGFPCEWDASRFSEAVRGTSSKSGARRCGEFPCADRHDGHP